MSYLKRPHRNQSTKRSLKRYMPEKCHGGESFSAGYYQNPKTKAHKNIKVASVKHEEIIIRTVEERTIIVPVTEIRSREDPIKVVIIITVDKQETNSNMASNPLINQMVIAPLVGVHADVVINVTQTDKDQIMLLIIKKMLGNEKGILVMKTNKQLQIHLIKKSRRAINLRHP